MFGLTCAGDHGKVIEKTLPDKDRGVLGIVLFGGALGIRTITLIHSTGNLRIPTTDSLQPFTLGYISILISKRSFGLQLIQKNHYPGLLRLGPFPQDVARNHF